MDAFAGIFDPAAGRGEVGRALERMREVLDPSAVGSRCELASADGVGCVVLDHHVGPFGPSLARDEGRGLWLALAGEVFGLDELRSRCSGAAREEGGAELCLRLLLSEGPDFVRHLNGHFNIAVYDEGERRLSIATDPFGYRPLFLARRGARLLFASEMKAIVAALDGPPEVDGIGLLQLFRHGWSLGERTWLQPVRVASAGTWYDATPTSLRSRRYFRFGFRRDGAPSLDDYADELAARLRRAARRATEGGARVAIATSAGLDSRSLLLASPRQRLALAYTFGRAESRDVTGAVGLARIAGVPHLPLAYGPGYLGRCLSPLVWRSEGLLPFSEVTFTSLHFHDVLAAHADVLLYGHAGDALTGAHMTHRTFFSRSRSRLIERSYRRYNRVPEEILQRVFRPSFYRTSAAALPDAWRETFTDIEQEDPADLLDVWDLENRQRRGTFPSAAVDRGRFDVRAPFLDREVVDHLGAAPPRWRLQQLAYKRMIVRAFPHAAAVPWSYTGGALHAGRAADFGALAARYARRRLEGVWPAAAGPAAEAFRDLEADTRADLAVAQAIVDFAASPSFPGDILDRGGVEEAVRRHWEGGEDLTHLVSVLATFATAYEMFVDPRRGAPRAWTRRPEIAPPPHSDSSTCL